MSATAPLHLPTRWKGPWLLAVAALHTAFAAVVFAPELAQLWRQGLFNAVGQNERLGAVAWFVLFGLVLGLLGAAVHALDQRSGPVDLRALGIGLLALTALGLLLMPASGFWLALPPALAMLRRPDAW